MRVSSLPELMKRYVVLSVNENPEYQYYLPLVCWAWRKFGWEPITFNINGFVSLDLLRVGDGGYYALLPQEGYKSETISQISRLYAACVLPADSYIMTSDADMVPLSDYWQYDYDLITTWGHDLTSYEHFPICYAGMNASRWKEVMNLDSDDYNALIKRDLDSMPNAKSEDSVKRWVVDQDLLTERIKRTAYKNVIRGTYENGYPVGRVDRSAWTLDHKQLIDCHMERGIYNDFNKMVRLLELLRKVWPDESFQWFVEYTNEFKKLV